MTALHMSNALNKIKQHVDPDDKIKKITFYNGSAVVIMESKKYFHVDINPTNGFTEVTMKPCFQSSKVEYI